MMLRFSCLSFQGCTFPSEFLDILLPILVENLDSTIQKIDFRGTVVHLLTVRPYITKFNTRPELLEKFQFE
jgi:hypothetical protein